MTSPRRQADQDRAQLVTRTAGGLVRRREATKDRVTRGMFRRDVDAPVGPGIAERLEGGQQMLVDDALERAGGEHLVEDLFDPDEIE